MRRFLQALQLVCDSDRSRLAQNPKPKMSKLQNIRTEIRTSLLAEAERLRAAGATDADVHEDVFIEMVSRKVAAQTFDDLGCDERKEIWLHFVQSASPEQLRNTAKNLRAKGEVDTPYDLEHLADLREREDWRPTK
jgi:hypothetical protein